MLASLNKIDIFGSQIFLRFNGESTYKPKLGSTVTLSIIGIISFRFISILLSISKRTDPTVIYSERQVDNPAQFIATSTSFPLAFAMEDPVTRNYYIDESIYTVQAQLQQKYLVFNNQTQQYDTVWDNREIKVQACTKENFQNPENADYYLQQNYTNMYCFSPDEQLSIQGDFPSPTFQQIYFVVQQCQTNCKSEDEINYYLLKSGFGMQLSDSYVDPTIKSNPFKIYSRDMYWPTSVNLPQDIIIFLRNNYVYSDFGWISSDIQVQNYPSYSFYENFVYPPNFQSYFFSATFRFEKQKEGVYQRSYSKLTDILSQIGGFSQSLLAIGFIICSNFSQLQLNQQMVNSVFNYDDKEENNQENNMNEIQKSMNIQKDQIPNQNLNMGKENTIFEKINESQFNQNKADDLQTNVQLVNKMNEDMMISQKMKFQQGLQNSQYQSKIKQQKTTQKQENTNNNNINQQEILNSILIEQIEVEKNGTKFFGLDKNQQIIQDKFYHEKQKLYEKQQKLIENRFDELMSKQTKSMKLSIWEYFKSVIYPCGYLKDKKKIISYSIDKLYYNLDIMNILKRLIEVEKLKRLLLNSDQIKLFDYLPKPTINPYLILKNAANQNVSKSQEVDLLYQDNRSEFQRVKDAFEAYKNIQARQEHSLLDQKIIEMLDPNLVSVFNVQSNMNNSKNNFDILNSPNQIKQSIFQSKIVTQDAFQSNRNTLIQKDMTAAQLNSEEVSQIRTCNSPDLLESSRIAQQNLDANISQYCQVDEVKETINKQDQQNNVSISNQTPLHDKTFQEEIASEEKYEVAMQKLEPFENQKMCEMSFTKL
ncbi:small GTP-binding domain protein (macronuclear) [Tetrahymena thermophila SB210]|uniref:Small GTP-binding domain protein n=1 Tax=Tetrahymena thermophila (strain SB210) TaxID=312017 RepID=Q22SE7_TETTS|nr:small GTP-binding domain protein [Tetrahymena thermophila SB210]EAR87825.2 small GTP-binding domain protein [Tetrahymena thermophila SB210]|eukprot:XP_001008070.2 small GTP-binding domain protein [Tetrahymena thermophila SB210]